MKKEVILSFKPEYFKPIMFGMKKYEYRKRFNKEPLRAYLYLSRPAQTIIGILELGKAIRLNDLIETLDKESIQYENTERMLEEGDYLAIPIEELKLFDHPLSLEEIQWMDPKFKPPMSYAYASNYPSLHKELKSRTFKTLPFKHNHKTIDDNIGVFCSTMEREETFMKSNTEYRGKYPTIFKIIE